MAEEIVCDSGAVGSKQSITQPAELVGGDGNALGEENSIAYLHARGSGNRRLEVDEVEVGGEQQHGAPF